MPQKPKSKGKSSRPQRPAKPAPRPEQTHGGKRPGAGRKTTEARKLRAEIVAECEREICNQLPRLIANMIRLACGGYERVEDEWGPPLKIDLGTGTKSKTESKTESKTKLVLVKRKVSIADADRAANQYLIDRILGKPTERLEHSGADGKPIQLEILDAALRKVYGTTTDDK